MDFSIDEFWRDDEGAARLRIRQPKSGFRLGTATMLLAASLPAQTQGLGFDFGAGVGSVGMMIKARLPAVAILGIEKDQTAAALAQANTQDIDGIDVVQGDVLALSPSSLPQSQADWMVSNPPFYEPGSGRIAKDGSKALAHQALVSLEDWMAACKVHLKAGARLYMVLPARQLQAYTSAASRLDFGAVQLRPVHSYAHTAARLMLVSARKNRRGDAQIEPSLILYEAPNQHTQAAKRILNQGCGILEALQNL